MRIAIFAAGGLARVICEALEVAGLHKIIGFFDDKKKGSFCNYPILGRCSEYKNLCKRLQIQGVIIAFGYYFLDKRLLYYSKIAKEKKLALVNAIHPQAVISPQARLGKGIYVGPAVTINPGTKVGDTTVIWSGSIIEHDNIIGKNVFITPGVKTAGYTKIGDNSFIGMGSIITKAVIGKNVTVGAASLVLDNVKSNKFIFGTPAEIIRTKKKLSYV